MQPGRITFDHFKDLGFPHVRHLGRNNNLQAIRPLSKHTHAGAFEMVYLAQGSQIWGASGRGYFLQGNDLFVTKPDERHSTGRYPVSKSLFYWIQLEVPSSNAGWFGFSANETRDFVDALKGLDSPQLRGRPHIQDLFETTLSAAQKPATPHATATLRHALMGLVLEIVQASTHDNASTLSRIIADVVRAIRTRVREPLRAADLAAGSDLSLSRLRTRFKEETGVALGQYITRAKVDAAMDLLDRGYSVTDTAFDLSFSSSQYFATVFKQYTMQTPRAYQRTGRAAGAARTGSGSRPPASPPSAGRTKR